MRRWSPVLAALAGALAVLGYSPFDFFSAALAAWTGLFLLWSREPSAPRSAALGLAFGLAFFGTGTSWVFVSLSRFGGMPWPLAGIATLGFCAWLALFPAAVGWVQSRVPAPASLRFSLVVPAAWTIGEWLRGEIFTGFPWLSAGEASVGTALSGFAPSGGWLAAGFAALACAGLFANAITGVRRRSSTAVLVLAFFAGAGLQGVEWTSGTGSALRAALLQGNVAQDLKFDPRRYARTLETYARLAESTGARLVVLPETAVPRFLEDVDPTYLDRLAAVARRNGGDLLLGVPQRDPDGAYYNAVVSLGTSARQWYRKTHLVPFGEFIPPGLEAVLRVLSVPLSNFSRGPGNQPALEVAGERIAVNVCYEDAFGDAIRRRAVDATVLVNVSNVAWFGDSLAPAQHLRIARLRAIETGRSVLTATNSGITAAIRPDGVVIAELEPFIEGVLEATVPARTGATPYVRHGDWPVLLLCLLILGAVPTHRVFRTGRQRPPR